MVGKQPIVLLKAVDTNKFLPIWIGHPEAAAILMKLQGATTPRPMTHDLLFEMLGELEVNCSRVAVTELRENTFYASITLTHERPRGRDRLAAQRRARARGPVRRADLRRRGRDRRVGDRVRARGRGHQEVVDKFKEFLDQVHARGLPPARSAAGLARPPRRSCPPSERVEALDPGDVVRVALAHPRQALGRVAVELGEAGVVEHGQHVLHQRPPACHPLEEHAVTVLVGAVELRAREPLDEPAQQPLVAHVHLQRHLRLAAVAAEGAFGDQEAGDDALCRARSAPRRAGGASAAGSPGTSRGATRQPYVFHRAVERETASSSMRSTNASKADAGRLGGLRQQGRLGEAGDHVGLQHGELAGLASIIRSTRAKPVATEHAVGGQRPAPAPARVVSRQVGRAHEVGAADLVARLEVVELASSGTASITGSGSGSGRRGRRPRGRARPRGARAGPWCRRRRRRRARRGRRRRRRELDPERGALRAGLTTIGKSSRCSIAGSAWAAPSDSNAVWVNA